MKKLKYSIHNIVRLVLLLSLAFGFLSCSTKQRLKKADKKYEVGEYYNASLLYSRIYPKVKLKEKPLKAYSAYQLGNCYRLINQADKAERAYANAIRNNYNDSTVYLYYANILRQNKKSKEAIAQYDIYLEKHPDDVRAINGKQSAIDIEEWRKNPTRYKVAKADFFSSKRTEFCPSFPGGDPDVVYFNSTRENKEVGGSNSKITGVRNNSIYLSLIHI